MIDISSLNNHLLTEQSSGALKPAQVETLERAMQDMGGLGQGGF